MGGPQDYARRGSVCNTAPSDSTKKKGDRASIGSAKHAMCGNASPTISVDVHIAATTAVIMRSIEVNAASVWKL
jgi:hypothetical protein